MYIGHENPGAAVRFVAAAEEATGAFLDLFTATIPCRHDSWLPFFSFWYSRAASRRIAAALDKRVEIRFVPVKRKARPA